MEPYLFIYFIIYLLGGAEGAISIIIECHKNPVWHQTKTCLDDFLMERRRCSVIQGLTGERSIILVGALLEWNFDDAVFPHRVSCQAKQELEVFGHTHTHTGELILKAGYWCLSRSFNFMMWNSNRSAAVLVHWPSVVFHQLSASTGSLLKSSGWKMSNQIEAAQVRHYRERWGREMVCNFLSPPGRHAPAPGKQTKSGPAYEREKAFSFHRVCFYDLCSHNVVFVHQIHQFSSPAGTSSHSQMALDLKGYSLEISRAVTLTH